MKALFEFEFPDYFGERCGNMHRSGNWWLYLCLALGLGGPAPGISYGETTVVVAADGSGEFKSVQEAVMKFPDGRADDPVVIHIKPGTYREPIYLQRE